MPALHRELDCVLAEACVQHCGSELKHGVGAAVRPARLPALVHVGTHQVVDRAPSNLMGNRADRPLQDALVEAYEDDHPG